MGGGGEMELKQEAGIGAGGKKRKRGESDSGWQVKEKQLREALKPGVLVAVYTQSSILRNTEAAPTHQSVSYLNAFPRCDPSMPGCPCCRIQGESLEIIAFPGAEPF
jgi:hypothetical protein